MPTTSSVGQNQAEQPRRNNIHIMLSLPKLETLIKIEATIWINSKGKFVSLPLEEFYTLARTHEWTGSTVSRGDSKDDITHAKGKNHASSTKLSKQVEELTQQLSEEERLLFNLMAVSSWKSSEMTSKLYPLFQIVTTDNNKYQLEMLKPPESVTMAVSSPNSVSPTKAKTQLASVPRSEVLRNMYVQSKKYIALVNDSTQTDSKSWWENASNTAQMILAHRKLNAKKMNTKTEAVEAAKNIPASAAIITTNDEIFTGKKMTLEERVRAKSQLRKKSSSTSTVDKTLSATTSRQSEEKALLELADALRSYSQRRGGSASNAGRLPMSDFVKDANVAWNAIVHNESVDKTTAGGQKLETSRTIATPKLAKEIPNWIHLRAIPSSLSSLSATTKERKPKKSAAAPTASQQNAMDRKSMRSAIIVIRNDAVDYAKDVRAKLGGRTHQSNSLGKEGKNNSRNAPIGGKKRSLKDFLGQNNAAADAIVPPSFLKRYDKMLKE
eukprot:scaffold32_cov112-Skeletonema_marinoi.AAC.1